MPTPSLSSLQERNLLYMSTPSLWSAWPYLPLIRRNPGKEEDYGVIYDVFHAHGVPGYSSTVFLCNLFLLPDSAETILALPREVFDSAEEIYASGWRVD